MLKTPNYRSPRAIKRKRPTFKEEKALWNSGYDFVIGIDEVGRGSFAGPVTVAAVAFTSEILPKKDQWPFTHINDSKLLSPKHRTELFASITQSSYAFSIASVDVPIINKVGIGKATFRAMRKAIRMITADIPENKRRFVLVDGFHVKYIKAIGLRNQKAIIKGDQKSISIAAASILAKVHRDNLMMQLHEKYPHYNFAKHKGYGTKEHQQAIRKHGLSKVHRKSFNLTKFTK